MPWGWLMEGWQGHTCSICLFACLGTSTTTVTITYHHMDSKAPSQHPSLELGRLRIPGPTIPLIILVSPFIVQPRTRRRLFAHLKHVLALSHLLLYIYNIHGLFTKNENEHTNILPFLEYLTLVLGETALEETNFWLYVSVAEGWFVSILPSEVFNRLKIPISTRQWAPLLLSIPSALRTSKPLSSRVMISALSLLTRMTLWVSNDASTVHAFSTCTLYHILLPVLAVPCYAMCIRTARSYPWPNRRYVVLQTRLRYVQHYAAEQCADVHQAGATAHILLATGWIISSFIFTCFRWRWLLYGEASRAPAWSKFSFLGGWLFVHFHTLVSCPERREPVPRLGPFTRRYLKHCLAATWWTNAFYVALWLVCEGVCAARARYMWLCDIGIMKSWEIWVLCIALLFFDWVYLRM